MRAGYVVGSLAVKPGTDTTFCGEAAIDCMENRAINYSVFNLCIAAMHLNGLQISKLNRIQKTRKTLYKRIFADLCTWLSWNDKNV